FVAFVAAKVSKILAEQLKRLSIESFTQGTVAAAGPDFPVQYLSESGNKEKLLKALEAFSGSGGWQLKLRAGDSTGGAAPGSLLEEELRERKQQEKEKAQSISNHPKIKSLQKVFPGSTIEGIKIRE